MNLVAIPQETRNECKLLEKRMAARGEHRGWWYLNERDLPSHAILARTTGNGSLKAGLTVFLIAGHDRDVYVGPNCNQFKLHEYVALVEGTGTQVLTQLGRDIYMA